MNFTDLASHFRLYNYFIKSGAEEDKIESFIDNINSGDVSPEKVVSYLNQLYDISGEESIPLDQVSGYINKKLEEKQKIDQDIQQADAVLQSKNVSIEAINEHIKLNAELEKHGLSTDDIHKLLNVLINSKKYGFDGKEIAEKLYNFKFLEWKEKELKDKRKRLTKRISKYKDIVPLTEDIAAFGIGINELLALKVAIKGAAKHYRLPPLAATLRLIDDIKKYNKIYGLKRELERLSLQKFAINEACSGQSRTMMALLSLQAHGMTEQQIIAIKNFLANNEYNIDMKPNG